jgi:hypothetical protein
MIAQTLGWLGTFATLCASTPHAEPDLSRLPPAATFPVVFARDIEPLLQKHCVSCHGAEKQKGGLRLDHPKPAMQGGDGGKVIEPGNSAASRLVHLVAGLEVDDIMPPKGAPLDPTAIGLLRAWIDAGASWPDDGRPVVVRSDHWSLQPIRDTPGASRTSEQIDTFVQSRLAEHGLSLSPEADRLTLIRRLNFDLIGLPPSPEEIDAFVNDTSADAYTRLVDRLLASPHYGERWGRHWLDTARYTESHGFEYDKLRPNAWHYRDYVIASFNADKPYDQFMREQVAGDAFDPATSETIVAASLLVCGPWDEAGNSQANATQRAITREDEMEDLLGVVGQSFLGLTVNCARCHAHKSDPIPHEDYFRMKAVFDGVKHGERSLAGTAEVRAHQARRAALETTIAKATAQTAELKAQELDDLGPVPEAPVSYAGTRVQPPPTRRLVRGDVTAPDEIVTPGALSAIASLSPDFGLAADAPEAERRVKFAGWLADRRNPLPARVMANRVWHYHFGQGLVATPNDFGVSGARPSHPDLLDWLAMRFIESGWSVKSLHRLIVQSAVYRQSSGFVEKAAAIDAENTLLWRYAPRRLEAEAVRDAMLAVSGQLNRQLGGPSFQPFDVIPFPANAYAIADKVGPEFNRRTIYRMNVNSGKDPLLDAFDCPDPSVKTPRRGVTTTPLQALGLMNGSFVQRQASHLADRAAAAAAPHDLAAAVRTAWRLALGRTPSPTEEQRAVAAARERGLSSVCWALLNTTEFVYVR